MYIYIYLLPGGCRVQCRRVGTHSMGCEQLSGIVQIARKVRVLLFTRIGLNLRKENQNVKDHLKGVPNWIPPSVFKKNKKTYHVKGLRLSSHGLGSICAKEKSTCHTHTHIVKEQHPRHRHRHTRQEQHPKPPNEHLPQTLNNARRWRDDGACHLPRQNRWARKNENLKRIEHGKDHVKGVQSWFRLICIKKTRSHVKGSLPSPRVNPNPGKEKERNPSHAIFFSGEPSIFHRLSRILVMSSGLSP